jgi:hypothetical protein
MRALGRFPRTISLTNRRYPSPLCGLLMLALTLLGLLQLMVDLRQKPSSSSHGALPPTS